MNKERTKVLVVEDDPNLGTLLSEYLDAKGYSSTLCKDGQQGFETFTKGEFDFCILDVMMPVKDGFTLAKEIRKLDKKVPMVFLTAKAMKEDTMQGFDVGADDYITKPFSMEELLARMTAILRRTSDANENDKYLFKIGSFQFDARQQALLRGKEKQKLTTRESELLRLLCANQNDVLERSVALKAIWDDDSYFNSRSMDVYITKLRKYLKSDPAVEIVNVHGKGFKIIEN